MPAESHRTISITFSKNELKIIQNGFNELLSGGSTKAIQRTANVDISDATELEAVFSASLLPEDQHFYLNECSWRLVYNALNAMIYGLGEFELQTVTGFSLTEIVNVNLKIASKVWGVYGAGIF